MKGKVVWRNAKKGKMRAKGEGKASQVVWCDDTRLNMEIDAPTISKFRETNSAVLLHPVHMTALHFPPLALLRRPRVAPSEQKAI
jgi:hypothetical protein